MRSWLDRDLWGSPTVCKSGRSSSTASPDCTTKDRCWRTRRGYKVLPSVQLPGLLKQSAFATGLELMGLRSRKCILKIFFLFYFADFCCNKPTTSYHGTQNAVGFYTRWHMIRRNMCCCKLCEIVHSKCNVEKLLHLLGFRFIWNTFTFNVVILQLCVISNNLKNPVEVAVDPCIHPRQISLATGLWSKTDNSDQLRPGSLA